MSFWLALIPLARREAAPLQMPLGSVDPAAEQLGDRRVESLAGERQASEGPPRGSPDDSAGGPVGARCLETSPCVPIAHLSNCTGGTPAGCKSPDRPVDVNLEEDNFPSIPSDKLKIKRFRLRASG